MTKARDLADIISGGFTASDIPTLTSDKIPNLDAAKITSGTFADGRLSSNSVTQHVDLTQLSASNLTSGTVPSGRLSLGASDIPNLDSAKITSGTIADARLPTVPTTKGGTGLTSLGSAGQLVQVNSAGNALEFAAPAGGGTISAYGMSYNHSQTNLINGFGTTIAMQGTGSSTSGNYLSDSTVIKMGATYNTSAPYNSMWLQTPGRYLVTIYLHAGFGGTSNGGTGASVQWEPYYIRNNQMTFISHARSAQIYQEKMVISNTNYSYRVGQTITFMHTATTSQEYITLKGNGSWASGNLSVYVINTFIAKYD